MIWKVKTSGMFLNYEVLTDFSLIPVEASVVRGMVYQK